MIQNRIWNNWELRCLSTFKIHAVPECRVFLLSCRYVYKPEENTCALQSERFVRSHCVVLVHHTEHNFEHFCLSYYIFRDQCFIQIWICIIIKKKKKAIKLIYLWVLICIFESQAWIMQILISRMKCSLV